MLIHERQECVLVNVEIPVAVLGINPKRSVTSTWYLYALRFTHQSRVTYPEALHIQLLIERPIIKYLSCELRNVMSAIGLSFSDTSFRVYTPPNTSPRSNFTYQSNRKGWFETAGKP